MIKLPIAKPGPRNPGHGLTQRALGAMLAAILLDPLAAKPDQGHTRSEMP